MNEEEKEIIERIQLDSTFRERKLLRIINNQKSEIEKKDEIINNAIIEIENLREYFSEDLQPDFIIILEILKDKKVIDW